MRAQAEREEKGKARDAGAARPNRAGCMRKEL